MTGETRRILLKSGLVGLVCAGLFAAFVPRLMGPAGPGRGGGLQSLASDAPAQLSSFVDEAGAPISVEAFRGRILVLNLWASWCVPCLQEMPSLDWLAEVLPQDQFAVIAVSQDRSAPETVKRSFERLGLHRLKLYLDPAGKLAKEIGARGMPTTLILSAEGKPLSFREGAATWDSEDTLKYLRGLQSRT